MPFEDEETSIAIQDSGERMPDLQKLTKSLDHFTAHPSSFQILHSHPPSLARRLPPSRRLYILDSSFNPPTLAHFRICAHVLAHHRSLCHQWQKTRKRRASESRRDGEGGAAADASPATNGGTQPIDQEGEEDPGPPRLVLLLSTKNADKAPAPASFGHRLAMMQLLSEDLHAAWSRHDPSHPSLTSPSTNEPEHDATSSLHAPRSYPPPPNPSKQQDVDEDRHEDDDDDLVIDVAVTTSPLFTDKLSALEAAPAYTATSPGEQQQQQQQQQHYSPSTSNRAPPRQIHLMGADTLLRVLDPKYYPPDHLLSPLSTLLGGRHRLRVSRRPKSVSVGENPSGGGADEAAAGAADRESPDALVSRLATGRLAERGGRAEWARRIEVVDTEPPVRREGEGPGEGGGGEVSSTQIRRMRAQGDGKWRELCTPRVGDWVEEYDLYS